MGKEWEGKRIKNEVRNVWRFKTNDDKKERNSSSGVGAEFPSPWINHLSIYFISFPFFSLRYYEELISPTDFLTSPKSFMSSLCTLSLDIYTFSEAHLHLNVRYSPYTSNWSTIEGLNITRDFEQLNPLLVLAKYNFHSLFNIYGSFPQVITFSSCIHRNFLKELIFQIISMVP